MSAVKLYRPMVIDRIKSGKMHFVAFEPDYLISGKVSKKLVPPWMTYFRKLMVSDDTQAFLFDSGQNNPVEEVRAFQETADELASENLFHLPFPAVWIEDYFDDAPDSERYCYLCEEGKDGNIACWAALVDPDTDFMQVLGVYYWLPDLRMFGYGVANEAKRLHPDRIHVVDQISSMATLMLQKFVGTLAASNTVRERGEVQRRELRPGRNPTSKRGKDFKTVIYSYTHVGPPIDDSVPADASGYRPRKRHLVRGYTWGKNTRPKEDQRRIEPFWRGRGEMADPRQHYEVRT